MCGLPGCLQGACLCPVPGEGRCLEGAGVSFGPSHAQSPPVYSVLSGGVCPCLEAVYSGLTYCQYSSTYKCLYTEFTVD